MGSDRGSYTLNGACCKNTCWSKRNNLERVLIVLVVVALILILGLFIKLMLVSNHERLCTTPECVTSSSKILEFVDESVDPCTDFYSFACGTFNRHAHETHVASPLHSMQESVKQELVDIIADEYPVEVTSPRSLRLQRRFYKACTNTTAIEEDKNVTFQKILEELGGWPVMKRDSSWNEEGFNWVDVMVKSRKTGVTFSRFLELGPDYPEDFTVDDFEFEIANPFISPEDKLTPEMFENHVDYITDIAGMLGAASYFAKSELRKSVEFQQRLHYIADKAENSTEKPINISIKSLQQEYPQVDWLNLINNLTDGVLTYNENSKVVLYPRSYLDDLFQLLAVTDKRTQANYIVWQVIENNLDFLSKSLRDRKMQYEHLKAQLTARKDKQVNEIKTPSRKEICVNHAKKLFPNVAEAIYVRKHITNETLQDVTELIEEIKKQLKKKLKNSDWMDKQTKSQALSKLKSIKQYIGGPPYIFDVEQFEKANGFDTLRFNSDNVIEMKNSISLNGINNYFNQLNMKVKETVKNQILDQPYVVVNSYYQLYYQTLIVSAGMLQGIFYENNRPRYINYGALGGMIGHEFTHGFSKHDGITKIPGLKDPWWTNETISKFNERAKCVQQEFDNLSDRLTANWDSNSTHTLEENICDFTGADLAYEAYQSWVDKHGHELELPGLKYTPNQIFWISYSSYMCFEPLKDQKNELYSSEGAHASPPFRILGPLRNSRHFAKDFSCPENSFMNPKNKCRLY